MTDKHTVASGKPPTDHQEKIATSATELPLVAHLTELRSRIIKSLLAVLILFLGLVGFANPIYSYLAQPLITALPAGNKMIATEVISPFLVPIKLVLYLAFYGAIPWIFYQIWSFISPGLYPKEKRILLPVLFSGTFLFYLGIAFSYYIVLPMMSRFLVATTPTGVDIATDIHQYLSTVLSIFLIFGLVFEIPIIVIILVMTGVFSLEQLANKRRYVIVIMFVIAAIVTPPDPLSQITFAVIGILLFELGLLITKFLQHSNHQPSE